MNFDEKRRNGEMFPELKSKGSEEFSMDESSREAKGPEHEERRRRMVGEQPIHKRQEVIDRVERTGSGPLWAAFALLLILLAGACAYGFQTLRASNIQVSQIPSMLKSMSALDNRVDALGGQLQTSIASLQNLSDKFAQMQKSVKTNYARARKHSEDLNAALEQRIEDRLDGRDYVVNSRLEKLETGQQAQLTQIADLRNQLTDARQEIADLRRETNTDLATLHQQSSSNDERLTSLNQQLERSRVNFEVSKDQPSEIVPDISINLTATNVSHQRFSGWIYYLPDRRFLWIKDHGVQQPIVFYGRNNSRQYQVVLTSVQKGTAVGYLLKPAEVGEPAQIVASKEPWQ